MKRIYTIGFTKKGLSEFIRLLKDARIDLVVDIRLNPDSQLAGYSKRRDLTFLLKEGFGIDYCHEPQLAPSKEILGRYRKDGNWQTFEEGFLKLLGSRPILKIGEKLINRGAICLLCSEPTPEYCHRRLVAEDWAKYLGIEVCHL